MIYPSIDKLLLVVDSKYRLVHLASERANEIALTGHLQKPEREYVATKNLGRALEEIADGLIDIKYEEGED